MLPADLQDKEKKPSPYHYGLFALLKQLEQQRVLPVPLGRSRDRSDEPVAITQPAHVAFAPTEVRKVAAAGNGRLDIEQLAFGLLGPNGPLPLHLSQLALERQQAKDTATVDFLNIFHHRMASLFYRAWADAEPTVGADRPAADAFVGYLYALAGIATPGARDRDAVPDVAKARRAALLGGTVRTAEGLQALLSDYFGLPVRVRSFVGEWLEIPRAERCRLGARRESSCLGGGAVLGSASWQRGQRFEICIGPLDAAGFATFQPGKPALRELADWVRLYTHDEWGWSLRLAVEPAACRGVKLGKGARLGWNSWLGRREQSSEDVVLRGETLGGNRE